MICLYSLSLSLYTNVYVVSFGSYFSCDRVVVFFLSIYRRFVAWKFESKREKKLEIQIKSINTKLSLFCCCCLFL